MTRADFVQAVHVELGNTIPVATIKKVLDASGTVGLTSLMMYGLAEVPLFGLGKLEVVGRRARKGRNPRTGETIAVPAKWAVKYKPASAVKTAMKEYEGQEEDDQ